MVQAIEVETGMLREPTEREIIREMVEELTKARGTLREQLAGLENQLYVLKRLGDRMAAAKLAAAPPPEPQIASRVDPLEALGLATPKPESEPPEWADPAGMSAFDPDPLVPDPEHPGELITREEAARIAQED